MGMDTGILPMVMDMGTLPMVMATGIRPMGTGTRPTVMATTRGGPIMRRATTRAEPTMAHESMRGGPTARLAIMADIGAPIGAITVHDASAPGRPTAGSIEDVSDVGD